MADITLQAIADAIPAGNPIKSWLDSLPPLPMGVSVSQAFADLMTGAAAAAEIQNQALPPNQKISGYIAPQWTSTQSDGKGNLVVRGRAALDFVKVLPVHNAITAPIVG